MPLFGRTTQMLMDVREATKSNPQLLVVAHNERFSRELAERFARMTSGRIEQRCRIVKVDDCLIYFVSATRKIQTAGSGVIAPVFVDHAVWRLCTSDQRYAVSVLWNRVRSLMSESTLIGRPNAE